MLVGLVVAALIPAYAQILETRNGTVIADVVDVKGEEDFTPVELGDWRDVVLGQDLAAGDMLRTGAYGGMGISFTDRTYIRLHANTQMAVADPGGAGAPRKFELGLGRLWSRASRPDQGVIVETPTATAAVRGTDWYMEVAADGTSRLVVLDGDVRFFNALGELSVTAGTSAIARPGLAPEFELLILPSDRPRWALTPRSDWITYLPFKPVVASATSDMVPVWQSLADVQPRAARVDLNDLGAVPADEAGLAKALMALMQRDPMTAQTELAALDLWRLAPEQTRLANATSIGAQIDLANFPQAIRELDAYEADHGRDLSSSALRAYLEAYAGRYDVARELADESARIAPADWRHRLLAAQIGVLQADDDAVSAATADAIALAPDSAAAWYWRALYLASAGGASAGEVLVALERAAELNPEQVTAKVAIGQLAVADGRPDHALAFYDEALALDPTEPIAVAGKAYVHLTMDRLDRADAELDVFRGTDAMLHPEVQAVLAIRDVMAGEPDRASNATGRIIAANPDRTGASQLDAIAHWQAGRRDVAIDVIENTMRLDPNDPVAARIASAMAQDQYRADDAVDFARAAWDAKSRNAAAGLVQLPASQSGRIDIGGAFQYAGLPAQGEYYSSLARAQADANSAFGFAQLYPNALARQSSTSIGLLLDPLSVTYPNRFATFFREPDVQQTLDVSASVGSDDTSNLQFASDSQALIRTPRQPIALAGFVSIGEANGPVDNDTNQSALVSLRAGSVRDGQHGFLGRLTVDHRDQELPGSFGILDRDDREETTNVVVGAGYTFRESFTDRWMFQASMGWSDRSFDNPSAFGSSLDPLDFSLAVSLGLENAQALAARQFFDTTFSAPGQAILAVDPPANLPVTTPVGQTLLPLSDDTDPVFDIESDATIVSLQSRRILSRGNGDFSVGLEYAAIDVDTRTRELAFSITGAGAIADFANMGAVTTFDLGEALPLDSELSSRSAAIQGHAMGNWDFGNAELELGVFPTWHESELESDFAPTDLSEDRFETDPRVGLSLRSDHHQLRVALQRTRPLPGIDSIAPIGAIGLLPSEDLGITSERTDSAIVRFEAEPSSAVFVHATAEHQDLENVSASLPGERIGQIAFFAGDASLTRLAIGADIRVGPRLALSAEVALNEGDIDSGLFKGRDLPVVPKQTAQVSATWVDPRFFRASGGVAFVGKRFADSGNTVELGDAVVLSAGLAVESRNKAWQLRVDGQLTSSEDSSTAFGQSATDSRLTLGLSRRW
ncbi:MAG: TonB-dependent receptor [Pseudomonadota bacterium]